MFWKILDVKWCPLYDISVRGTPYFNTQYSENSIETAYASMCRKVTTWVSFENFSTMTKTYWKPVVVLVNGLKRSKAIHSNERVARNKNIGLIICLIRTLFFAHFSQLSIVVADILGHRWWVIWYTKTIKHAGLAGVSRIPRIICKSQDLWYENGGNYNL